MNLENIKWKMPDMKGYTVYDFIYMNYAELANPETENRLVVTKGWEVEMETDSNRYRVSFWSDENLLGLVVMVA